MKKTKVVLGISTGGLILGGLLWWFFTQAVVGNEINGEMAIVQTRYATDTSLEETKAAVSDANFLVLWGGIDGTAFYQFRATSTYVQDFIARTNLQKMENNLPECQTVFKQNLWRSWWNPREYPSAHCYSGRYDGANYYLLYDADQNIAFLKIQDQ